MIIPSITPLPPSPQRTDPSTFAARADASLTAQETVFTPELNAFASAVNVTQAEMTVLSETATEQAQIATTQAAAAASSALSAGATVWVSGTTYTVGVSRYSPLDGQVYRRMVGGAGTTDPSLDAVNWRVVNGLTSELIVLPFNNLPSMRPSLNLDFANNQSVDPRITFTRASTATRTNNKGLIESAASGVPRIDYDAVTGACRGLLIEEQRTNLLLNSATLVTQNVTVAAAAHTISFYGTGTVTLSGVATGSLVGTGAYPTRSILTFTPTAGTLTLTVTGSCTDGQIEQGAFATTVIPTVGPQVTRAADVATMTGVNFSSWYRNDEGSFVAIASAAFDSSASLFPTHLSVNDGTLSNRIVIGQRTIDDTIIGTIVNAGVTQTDFSATSSATYSTPNNIALVYKTNDAAIARSGVLSQTDATLTVPTVSQMSIGTNAGTSALNGHIRSISYYPKRLTNLEIQALSTQ